MDVRLAVPNEQTALLFSDAISAAIEDLRANEARLERIDDAALDDLHALWLGLLEQQNVADFNGPLQIPETAAPAPPQPVAATKPAVPVAVKREEAPAEPTSELEPPAKRGRPDATGVAMLLCGLPAAAATGGPSAVVALPVDIAHGGPHRVEDARLLERSMAVPADRPEGVPQSDGPKDEGGTGAGTEDFDVATMEEDAEVAEMTGQAIHTNHIGVSQYSICKRSGKNTWKVELRAGILYICGRDYAFEFGSGTFKY